MAALRQQRSFHNRPFRVSRRQTEHGLMFTRLRGIDARKVTSSARQPLAFHLYAAESAFGGPSAFNLRP
jgi:hypothetical protein